MEMSDLRWILLGAAVVIVAAVYFFSRARKKSQPTSLLDAVDEVPSFSAQETSTDNDWMDGVGPVRVVAGSTTDSKNIPEVKFVDDEIIELASKENITQEVKSVNTLSNEPVPEKLSDEIEKNLTPKGTTEKQQQVAIDDVISVYVLAKVEEKLKGEKILSASYALHLDYGDMKIFHRHSQTSERKIEFSMANIQQPGFFEIDSMNELQTSGVSFFMQVNLVDNPSAVLDEMLICAHSLSTMLGAMLCNAQRNILDESSTNALREKVKYLESVKSQSV